MRYKVISIEVSCWMDTVIGKAWDGGRKSTASLERSVSLGNGNITPWTRWNCTESEDPGWLWWQRLGQTLYPRCIVPRQGWAWQNCCYEHQGHLTSLITNLFWIWERCDTDVSEIWYTVSLFVFHCIGLPNSSWNSFYEYNFIRCCKSLSFGRLSKCLFWFCCT